MRTFIAINFGEELRERLSCFNGPPVKGVKWVEKENLHLTLVFLGEAVTEANLKAVKDAMRCFAGFRSFELTVSNTGAFPDFERPRVLWAGIEKGREELSGMYAVLRGKLFKAGFMFEDRFSPHVTLGRVGKKPDNNLIYRFRRHSFAAGEMIGRVDLMESFSGPSGPAYRTLYSEELG